MYYYNMNPTQQFNFQINRILTYGSEGGEQHCQIGNHMLAIDKVTDWLESFER